MKRILLVSMILAAALCSSWGCSPKQLGSVMGVVVWQTQGAGSKVVVGITVNVWDAKKNNIAYGVSDSSGHYTITNISPGTYTITAYEAASEVGESIAEKGWIFYGIQVKSDKATQLDLTYDNSNGCPISYRTGEEPQGASSTDTTAPAISVVHVSSISSYSATVVWTTNEDANSQVEYGPTHDFGLTTTLDSSLVTSHSVVLPGLAAGTYYYYRVKSEDAYGNQGTSSPWDNFITPHRQDLAVGQTAQNANQRVTARSAIKIDHYLWEGSSGSWYTESATSGKVFIIVDAEVEYIGSDSLYTYIGDFSVSDGSGYRYEYALYYADDQFNSVTLYAGQKTGGKILFEVPTAATGLKLAYDLGDAISGPILVTWVL